MHHVKLIARVSIIIVFCVGLYLPADSAVQEPETKEVTDVAKDTEQADKMMFVEDGEPVAVREYGKDWETGDGWIECQGEHNILHAGRAIGPGEFHIRAKLTIFELEKSAASFVMEQKSHFGFEGATGEMFISGPLFGGGPQFLGDPSRFVESGKPLTLEVIRNGDNVKFMIDGRAAHEITLSAGKSLGMIGLRPWRSRMRVTEFAASGNLQPLPAPSTQAKDYTIPTIDLSTEPWRVHIVERKPGQYLGHPTTVLLEDQKTMFCTYPLGHGGPAAVLKKSTDGGKTWSDRLPVPDNWSTATNCPCIHRLTDPNGVERLFVFEGNGKMRQSVSTDNGETWTPFEPNGLHCVVAPITILPISGGRHLMQYHRGPNDRDRSPLTIWQAISEDGGLTWGDERMVGEFRGGDLCESALIRSPDGEQIASIMRENSRRYNSMLMTSDDEGQTWSEPVELPAALTGDRHLPRYAHDGRIVMPFRDVAKGSPTKGDFVAWVGTYEDMVNGREGQYRIRFYNSPVKGDLGYPGLELLPDGTFVATTYLVLGEGEKHSVASFHFKLEEIDKKAAMLPQEQRIYTSGDGGYHTYRIPSLCVAEDGTVLAICEARKNSRSDFGDIDLAVKRSTDNGNTFSDKQILADDGENTMGNPCPVVERESGDILLPFCRNNHKVFVMRSTDNGETFSKPRDITDQVKQVEFDWTRVATGPGSGIQTTSGRIVVPVWYMAGELGEESQEYRSGVIYSDDAGKNWLPGETIQPKFRDCNECEVVETTDGKLYLNMRTGSGTNRRAIAYSDDGGATWTEPQLDNRLVEPVCDASLIRLDRRTPDDEPIWLFSNPASKARNNVMVRASFDDGETWPVAQVLYPGPSAYSCLVELADGSIGCLYERGEKSPYEGLTFAKFDMEWLTYAKQKAERCDGPYPYHR